MRIAAAVFSMSTSLDSEDENSIDICRHEAGEERTSMKKKFKCEIDCANCAAKVEDAIKKLDGVQDAKVNFMLQKFTLEAADEQFDAILQQAIEVGKKIEPDFSVEL